MVPAYGPPGKRVKGLSAYEFLAPTGRNHTHTYLGRRSATASLCPRLLQIETVGLPKGTDTRAMTGAGPGVLHVELKTHCLPLLSSGRFCTNFLVRCLTTPCSRFRKD